MFMDPAFVLSSCLAAACHVAPLPELVPAIQFAYAGDVPVDSKPWPGCPKNFDDPLVEGTIVVHDLASGRRCVVNQARATRAYGPASTFKVAHTLIALSSGQVSITPGSTFEPPAEPYLVNGNRLLPLVCEETITLTEAFRASCIPVYQQIAVKIGLQEMKSMLGKIGFDGLGVDERSLATFWLDGSFKISALEQVEFLARLHTGELPFTPEVVSAVDEMMLLEERPGFILRGKTGYLYSSSPPIGWLVGSVVSNAGTTVFALNLDIDHAGSASKRAPLVRSVLGALGLKGSDEE